MGSTRAITGGVKRLEHLFIPTRGAYSEYLFAISPRTLSTNEFPEDAIRWPSKLLCMRRCLTLAQKNQAGN